MAKKYNNKFKTGDLVLADCRCGDILCSAIKDIPIKIKEIWRDQYLIEFDGNKYYYTDKEVRSANSYKIKQRLGIK